MILASAHSYPRGARNFHTFGESHAWEVVDWHFPGENAVVAQLLALRFEE
jgi:hypothetical protein